MRKKLAAQIYIKIWQISRFQFSSGISSLTAVSKLAMKNPTVEDLKTLMKNYSISWVLKTGKCENVQCMSDMEAEIQPMQLDSEWERYDIEKQKKEGKD